MLERLLVFLVGLGAIVGLGQPGIRGLLYQFLLDVIRWLQTFR